jgi:hypothetical protein
MIRNKKIPPVKGVKRYIDRVPGMPCADHSRLRLFPSGDYGKIIPAEDFEPVVVVLDEGIVAYDVLCVREGSRVENHGGLVLFVGTPTKHEFVVGNLRYKVAGSSISGNAAFSKVVLDLHE